MEEELLVGAFSVIVKTDGSFAALILTILTFRPATTHLLKPVSKQTK